MRALDFCFEARFCGMLTTVWLRCTDVFRYCSPTRRSMLSGRFPNHITSVQPDGANLCSDFLPLAATLLSEKLTKGGCERSHQNS